MEWPRLEGTSKIILFQPFCCGWGQIPLAAQSPIQPHVEHFLEWDINNFSRQPVAVPHHSHRNYFFN